MRGCVQADSESEKAGVAAAVHGPDASSTPRVSPLHNIVLESQLTHQIVNLLFTIIC